MSKNFRTITTHRVTPAAFAEWLHAQEQEPSVHVLAWFKAYGVAWPHSSTTLAEANPFPLAGWHALVAYRKATGGDWGLGNQLEIAEAEFEKLTKNRNMTETAALEAMALELGISRQSLSKSLKTQTDQRMRTKKKAPATHITTARDGKVINHKVA